MKKIVLVLALVALTATPAAACPFMVGLVPVALTTAIGSNVKVWERIFPSVEYTYPKGK